MGGDGVDTSARAPADVESSEEDVVSSNALARQVWFKCLTSHAELLAGAYLRFYLLYMLKSSDTNGSPRLVGRGGGGCPGRAPTARQVPAAGAHNRGSIASREESQRGRERQPRRQGDARPSGAKDREPLDHCQEGKHRPVL